MTTLPELLQAQMDEKNLSVTQVCHLHKINRVSFIKVLEGKAFPNARSMHCYVEFLGIPAEDIVALKPDRKTLAAAKQGTATGGEPGPTDDDTAGRPALATIEVFGARHSFASLDELLGFIRSETGLIRVEFLGRSRRFHNLGELQSWCEGLS
ncbi:MAG: hypothetical protein ACOCYN_04280, partial [Planctomycetota bacterium]